MPYNRNKTTRECSRCGDNLKTGQYDTCSMLCFITKYHAPDLAWYWKTEQGNAERWAHIGANSSIEALTEIKTLEL